VMRLKRPDFDHFAGSDEDSPHSQMSDSPTSEAVQSPEAHVSTSLATVPVPISFQLERHSLSVSYLMQTANSTARGSPGRRQERVGKRAREAACGGAAQPTVCSCRRGWPL
jgi:hypothetical protein